MKLTHHSKERIEERVGLTKEASEKLAKNALQSGITHGETVGRLNRYLTNMYFKNKTINNVRIYNRYIFLFANDILITVMNLPKEFHAVEDKIKKRKKEKENKDSSIWIGFIDEFNEHTITCILRKDFKEDKELTVGRSRLTDKQNKMVSKGLVIKTDLDKETIQFLLPDGKKWC